MKKLVALSVSLAAFVLAASTTELAARPLAPQTAAASVYDWTGFYLGAKFGVTFNQVSNVPDVYPVPFGGAALTAGAAQIGGTVGYNYQLPNNVVLGLEADLAYVDAKKSGAFFEDDFPQTNPWNAKLNVLGTLRARVGYAMKNWLPFVTAGVALSNGRVFWTYESGEAPDATFKLPKVGFVAGLGTEYAFDNHWSGKLEYQHIFFNSRSNTTQTFSDELQTGGHQKLAIDLVQIGLNYHFNGR